MAIEKRWLAVAPVALTASGTVDGKLTVSDTSGFKVKMLVTLSDPVLPHLALEIKRINSAVQLEVGRQGFPITDRVDTSSYGGTSSLFSVEQARVSIPLQEIERSTYEEEPTVARRVTLVDRFGRQTAQKDGSYNVNILNNLVKVPYDEIDLAYDPVTQNVTDITYKENGALVSALALTYDDDENLTKVELT